MADRDGYALDHRNPVRSSGGLRIADGDEMRTFGLSKVLVLAAVICFVLAALGVDVGKLDLIAIGLAFGFASFLV